MHDVAASFFWIFRTCPGVFAGIIKNMLENPADSDMLVF
jgi:hypothetical protein